MKHLSIWRAGAAAMAAATGIVAALGADEARAQPRYNPGDRVECNTVGSNDPRYEFAYEAGTVLAFRPGDQPDGSWYRVRADVNGVEYYCRVEHIRPGRASANGSRQLPTPPPQPPQWRAPAMPSRTTAQRRAPLPAPATRPATAFLECPVRQRQARNGSPPDRALVERIIRCAKGERAVPPGDEGPVHVEVSAIQIGNPRPWSYGQDQGSGQLGTIVYPVRATYTVTTEYRTAIEVEENAIRTLNFYVNAFGEWQIGSEERIRSPTARRLPRS